MDSVYDEEELFYFFMSVNDVVILYWMKRLEYIEELLNFGKGSEL